MTQIRSVSVIGAGQMGSGIAHVCALAGYDVRLHDLDRTKIDAGLEVIRGNLTRQAGRGIITDAQIGEALGRIAPSESLEETGSADLVIEAATENEDVKKAILIGRAHV